MQRGLLVSSLLLLLLYFFYYYYYYYYYYYCFEMAAATPTDPVNEFGSKTRAVKHTSNSRSGSYLEQSVQHGKTSVFLRVRRARCLLSQPLVDVRGRLGGEGRTERRGKLMPGLSCRSSTRGNKRAGKAWGRGDKEAGPAELNAGC